MLLRTIYPV